MGRQLQTFSELAAPLTALPHHIAIIMDGNGRWAEQRGLPRLLGHHAGSKNVRSIITAAITRSIRYLTLYVFSTENWSRPSSEVNGLMKLLSEVIAREVDGLHREGVHLRHLGRLDNLPQMLQERICKAVELTQYNSAITVTIALNYGGRADIVDAMRTIATRGIPPEQINEDCITAFLGTRGLPDPDLLIRTGGEQRLSNFLIWQSAYSELWTTPVLWPDFTVAHLDEALHDYARRKRRFGNVPDELNPLNE
jgi:undecaprenyl diphosphate synthase